MQSDKVFQLVSGGHRYQIDNLCWVGTCVNRVDDLADLGLLGIPYAAAIGGNWRFTANRLLSKLSIELITALLMAAACVFRHVDAQPHDFAYGLIDLFIRHDQVVKSILPTVKSSPAIARYGTSTPAVETSV